jgi:hypothetical protein
MRRVSTPIGVYPTEFAATGPGVVHGIMLYLPLLFASAFAPMRVVGRPIFGLNPVMVIYVLLDRPHSFWRNGITPQTVEALVHYLGEHDIPALVILVDQMPFSCDVRSRRSAAEGGGFTRGGFNAAECPPYDITGAHAASALAGGFEAVSSLSSLHIR